MILIISIVLVAISVLYYFYRLGRKSGPIDTIKIDGCLGFKIGDKRDLVESRIKHLNLLTDIERENYKIKSRLISDSITTSTKIFNNIENITFRFNSNDVLSTIFIVTNNEQCDNANLMGILINKISGFLGNYSFSDNESMVWVRNSNSVVLSINEEVVSICISKN
jgi:hypothetical protein